MMWKKKVEMAPPETADLDGDDDNDDIEITAMPMPAGNNERKFALLACVDVLSPLSQQEVGRVLATLATYFGLRYQSSDPGFR